MMFELIAVLLAGVAAGGVALLARRAIRRLPRWLVPVAAGLAMLLAAVSLEYSWYDRTASALPAGVEVALANENRQFWRPWTYARPFVDRFIAVDRGAIRTNDNAAGQRLADLYVFGRWVPARRMRAIFDCEQSRRADLAGDTVMDDGGTVAEDAWIGVPADDPVLQAVCATG
ncbi:hypothetical protein [Jannaschia rubra]|uniref:Uncharacterized protein n=1 Tax=Jannaschia rubra TaxID=282197 RepID=A0A0M6XL77_9RHOB|nr:hypothetical protein [Jannaschia rubra]CTQ31896.1 hypothetical protein JAN5088_00655 [Jannaschia rubra]SFG78292.1 hypothetical protein SAMN04488517_11535 [Jannaschia rubra]